MASQKNKKILIVTSLINRACRNITKKMSSELLQLSERRKKKELKVLELYHQGISYREIAKRVHLSLRDVTKYIHRISNKTKSMSTTSIHDEVVLEYRVNGLRHEVRVLESQKESVKNEVKDWPHKFIMYNFSCAPNNQN
jgi:DNA-binding NarL/FixJ family response regulator